MQLLKHKLSGFSLIEAIIVIALISVLTLVGNSWLSKYQIRENTELAKHILSNDIALMEAYYAKNGSYLITDSSNTRLWPPIIRSVVGTGVPVYSISFYPATASQANEQAYCLVATPNPGSIQAKESVLYIDKHGNLSYVKPSNCEEQAIDTNNWCANSSASFTPCSGNCSSGVYSGCSGNCNSVTICAGGTGCAGSCRNSIVYGGCSGNCHNSVVTGGCSGNCFDSTIFGGCTGNCKNSICCDNSGKCAQCK
jgi:prepilin-type N-terminal cleavage/methylation domain-containing protein